MTTRTSKRPKQHTPAPAECLALLSKWSDAKAREAATIAAEDAALEAVEVAEGETAAIERELTEIEMELCRIALGAVGRTPEDVDSTREAVIVVIGGHAFRVEGEHTDRPWSCSEVVPEDFIVFDW